MNEDIFILVTHLKASSYRGVGRLLYLSTLLSIVLSLVLTPAHSETIHMNRDFGYLSNDTVVRPAHKAKPVVSYKDAKVRMTSLVLCEDQ